MGGDRLYSTKRILRDILLYLVLLAGSPFQITPAVQDPADGIIEVTVRDSVTRAPLPDARVTLIGNPLPNNISYATSNAEGQAVFKELKAATYSINAQRRGHLTPGLQDYISRTIGPNTKRHQVDVLLPPDTTVSGRVLDPNGIPVVEAQVALAKVSYFEGRRIVVPVPIETVRTNDRGEYRIVWVDPGDYFVRVELGDTVWIGGESYWETFPRVIYYHGVVDPKTATLVSARLGQVTTAIDIKLPNFRTFKVSGTVINPTPGERPTGYSLASVDPDTLNDPISVRNRSWSGPNPDESNFELVGIPPGSYYLYPLWRTGTGPYVTSKTSVRIEDHDVEGLRIVPKPNGDIIGRVVVEGGVAPPPRSRFNVHIRSKERLPGVLDRAGFIPVDIAIGTFTLKDLIDTRFNITMPVLPLAAYVVDVRQGQRSVLGEGITPGSEPVEVVINLQGGTVQGVVRDARSVPASRATVTLIPSGTRRGIPVFHKSTSTNDNGQFSFSGVAPGEYKVFAWSALPQGQPEWNVQFLAPYEVRGVAVTVVAGKSAGVQLSVISLP